MHCPIVSSSCVLTAILKVNPAYLVPSRFLSLLVPEEKLWVALVFYRPDAVPVTEPAASKHSKHRSQPGNKAIIDHTSLVLCTPITPWQWRNGPVCCWMTLFAASTLQCIVNGEENCRNCPFPIEFRNRTEGGPSPRAQIFGKDCACCSGDMLADKQTHTGIQTYSSQYSATAAAGEIKITCWPYPSPDPWGKGLLLPLNQCSSAITQCQYMYNYTVSLCLKKKFPPFNCLNCL